MKNDESPKIEYLLLAKPCARLFVKLLDNRTENAKSHGSPERQAVL